MKNTIIIILALAFAVPASAGDPVGDMVRGLFAGLGATPSQIEDGLEGAGYDCSAGPDARFSVRCTHEEGVAYYAKGSPIETNNLIFSDPDRAMCADILRTLVARNGAPDKVSRSPDTAYWRTPSGILSVAYSSNGLCALSAFNSSF